MLDFRTAFVFLTQWDARKQKTKRVSAEALDNFCPVFERATRPRIALTATAQEPARASAEETASASTGVTLTPPPPPVRPRGSVSRLWDKSKI